MSSHQKLETYEPWLNQIANAAKKTAGLPDGVTVTDGVILSISDETPVENIFSMVVQLCSFDRRSLYQACVVRYNVGRMILEICARTKQTEDDVIIDCGLCQRTGLTAKTLLNWSSTAKRCPPSFLKPGISWTILSTMADIRPPEDPKKLLEFRQEQERVLEVASANPQEFSSRDAKAEMRGAMERLGLVKKKEPGGSKILLAYAILLRKLRFLDETGEAFQSFGFKDRADIVNQIEACEHSLVNMGILSVGLV